MRLPDAQVYIILRMNMIIVGLDLLHISKVNLHTK
jgi:hypothetical protein